MPKATADPADRALVAASLAARIDRVTFIDLDSSAVTALLIDAVVDWATEQGWRAYRRAPSVLPLPAPYQHRRSCVDVGCARPDGAPVVVEVDRSDRRRTMEKLLAEATAGRVACWVRWGAGAFAEPPAPITLIGCQVAARTAPGGRRRVYSRAAASPRPAPEHTMTDSEPGQQTSLFPA